MKRRVTTYVTTADLGFSEESAIALADCIPVSFDDAVASLTLIPADLAAHAIEKYLDMPETAAALLEAQVEFLAFVG